MFNNLDKAADRRGKDNAKPTPAPVRIAPIKNISKIILIGPDCFLGEFLKKLKVCLNFH